MDPMEQVMAQWAVFVEQLTLEFARIGEEAAKVARAFSTLPPDEETPR